MNVRNKTFKIGDLVKLNAPDHPGRADLEDGRGIIIGVGFPEGDKTNPIYRVDWINVSWAPGPYRKHGLHLLARC